MKHTLSVRINPDLYASICKAARLQGHRSISEFVEAALTAAIPRRAARSAYRHRPPVLTFKRRRAYIPADGRVRRRR